MATRSKKGKGPFYLSGTARELDEMFYVLYDPRALFSKAITLLYATKFPKEFAAQLENDPEILPELDEQFFSALRAEIYFTEIHQFEGFMGLLVAPFQDLPAWLYLKTYGFGEIAEKAKLFMSGDVEALTGKSDVNKSNLVNFALYNGFAPEDPQRQDRWQENIDNASWLIDRMAERYLEGLDPYNSYKHGLRVMAGSHSLTIRLEGNHAGASSPGSTFASPDALTFLALKDYEDGPAPFEVTRHFNPDVSYFYLSVMYRMLQTIKDTRLAALKQDGTAPQLNTFLKIDRDDILARESWRRFESQFPL